MLVAWFTLTWLMLDGFKKDLKGDIASVEIRLTENAAGVEARLKKEIAAVETRLSADIRETEARLDRRLARVENRLDRVLEIRPGSPGSIPPEEGPAEASVAPLAYNDGEERK